MTRVSAFFIVAAACLLGIFQGAFLPALGGPLALIDLPLIAAVWLTTRFRFPEALLIAVLAGLVRGTVSVDGAFTYAVAYALCTWIGIVLFTRIFTNRSWPGALGLTVAVYAAFGATMLAFRIVRAVLDGVPASAAFAGTGPVQAAVGLVSQTIAVILLFAVVEMGGRARRNRTHMHGRP